MIIIIIIIKNNSKNLSINQILFIAYFPLPRVGFFERSISKLIYQSRIIMITALSLIELNYTVVFNKNNY